MTDGEVLPNILQQTRRTIKAISGDGDTREYYQAIGRKEATPLIPPRNVAAFCEKGEPSCRLSETLRFKQEMEAEIRLPQTLTVRDGYAPSTE